MKLLVLLSCLTIYSCNIIDDKISKAIKLVQVSNVTIENENYWSHLLNGTFNNTDKMTWLEFANTISSELPNEHFKWSGVGTTIEGIYLISFVDSSGWGHSWQVNVDQKIVRHINQNEYLSRLYGLSRLDKSKEFPIVKLVNNELKLKKINDGKEVFYVMNGQIKNLSDRLITEAKINGALKLIFKDKTVEAGTKNSLIEFYSELYNKGNLTNFNSKATTKNIWKPNEVKEFHFKTSGLDRIYLDYLPEYVLFEIHLVAMDPTGYKFDKNIYEIDLKQEWLQISESKITDSNSNKFNSGNSKNSASNPSPNSAIPVKSKKRLLYPGSKNTQNQVGSEQFNITDSL